MMFMNELWFAVVPPPSAPTSFLMFLPNASTNLSVAKALDLGGRLVEDLRQVSSALKRVCAAAWKSPFENGVDRKGGPLVERACKRSLAENTEAMRRWSAGGGAYLLSRHCPTRNTRTTHFTPQHWLLCHMGLY